jgi:hypothetical protein
MYGARQLAGQVAHGVIALLRAVQVYVFLGEAGRAAERLAYFLTQPELDYPSAFTPVGMHSGAVACLPARGVGWAFLMRLAATQSWTAGARRLIRTQASSKVTVTGNQLFFR